MPDLPEPETPRQTERRRYFRLRGNTIEVFGRPIRLPASRIARVGLGVAFVLGGIFSFLPILGLWMLPVGLIILSIDFAIVRRWRRRSTVWWERRRERRMMEQSRQAAQVPTPRPAPAPASKPDRPSN